MPRKDFVHEKLLKEYYDRQRQYAENNSRNLGQVYTGRVVAISDERVVDSEIADPALDGGLDKLVNRIRRRKQIIKDIGPVIIGTFLKRDSEELDPEFIHYLNE